MAKFETNLSNKDKVTIAIVLFIALLFVVVWYGIRPVIIDINNLNDDIDQTRTISDQYKGKIMNLSSAESAFSRVTTDLSDSTSGFYPVMSSSEVDRMVTNYVLGFGLLPEDLIINMPDTAVEELPYLYSGAMADMVNSVITPTPTPTPVEIGLTSETEESSSEEYTPVMVDSLFTPYNMSRDTVNSTMFSGIEAATVSVVMMGDERICQSLLDDLVTKPSIRVTGFEWIKIEENQQYNEETGEYETVDNGMIRLRIDIRVYMMDVTDYNALVEEAVESAGAEG